MEGPSGSPRRAGGAVAGVLVLAVALLVALSLVALPGEAHASSFKDVPSGEWYTTWVKQASDKGLMSGFTDATGKATGYFGPDEPLTRAQVAMVLWRMAGSPSAAGAGFSDVHASDWHAKAVAWCVKAGVVTGYTSGPDKGCFRPDRPVSRQELATMVYRYAKHAGMDVSGPDPSAFKSTTDWRTADSWATEALTWTAAAGVLSGVDNHNGTKSVQPFGTATRAMAAKVFVVLSGRPSPAKASCTVAFDSNGGSAVKAQSVKAGSKATKPANPIRSGYTFKGWYADKALKKAYDFGSAVKSNITLYAKWEIRPQLYAVLYKDGLLSLQVGPDTDLTHGGVLGKWAWDGSSKPWYDKRDWVRTVIVRDKIAIKGGRCLFVNLSNCRNMDLSNLDASSVTDFSDMFFCCTSLISLDLSGWDVSSAKDLSYMFSDCPSLRSLDLSGWDVSSAKDLSSMFSGCTSLASLDLSGWDVSSVTDPSFMFSGCSSLSSLDLSGWNPSSAVDLCYVFNGCSSLSSLDLSGWDVSSAGRLSDMFRDCSSLTSLDLSNWNPSSATDLSRMFRGCSSLTSLDLFAWDVSSATKLSGIFTDCLALNLVTLGVGCDSLVNQFPSGPWYDAAGNEYATIPAGVAGTFTKVKPGVQAASAEVGRIEVAPQPLEGNLDGLLYVTVPEGLTYEAGVEYPELAGRYVGPGVYVMGYTGEADSVVLPLEIDGVPVVSANLAWNESDRVGMTMLSSVAFERADGKISTLVQLDVSGNLLTALDISGLDVLVRLNCEGNPIADLVQLQAWAAQEGHEARLPQAQQAMSGQPAADDDAEAPSESQGTASPDAPAEPAAPETPSTEPAKPSDPTVPSESGQPAELGQPGEANGPNEPEQPGAAAPGESDQTGDASDADEAVCLVKPRFRF